MSDILRAGIVGCGNITLNEHGPTLRGVAGVQVAAIADPVEDRRRKVQALLGLPDSACHPDHRRLLDAGVDYVVLTVPQKFRRPIVEDCARAGVHVLAEKPIATVPAEARAMIETMRAAHLRYGMIHNYLFYPEYRLARELIASGAIGALRHVSLNLLGMPDSPGAAEYRPRWRHDPAEAGGGILMDMVHVIYVAEFLIDASLRAVTAVVDNLDHPGEAVEDFSLVQCHFDSSYVTVNLGWGEGPGGVEIGGTEGRILIFYEDYGTGPFQPLESFTLVNRAGRMTYQPRKNWQPSDNFTQIHGDFVEAVRLGREPVAPAEAGQRSLEAVLAAYASAAMGRVVPLPLAPDDPVFQRGLMGLRELELWRGGPLVRRSVFGLAVT